VWAEKDGHPTAPACRGPKLKATTWLRVHCTPSCEHGGWDSSGEVPGAPCLPAPLSLNLGLKLTLHRLASPSHFPPSIGTACWTCRGALRCVVTLGPRVAQRQTGFPGGALDAELGRRPVVALLGQGDPPSLARMGWEADRPCSWQGQGLVRDAALRWSSRRVRGQRWITWIRTPHSEGAHMVRDPPESTAHSPAACPQGRAG